jgi:rare lipoprotein A
MYGRAILGSIYNSTMLGIKTRFSVFRCSNTTMYAALRYSKIKSFCLSIANCKLILALLGIVWFVATAPTAYAEFEDMQDGDGPPAYTIDVSKIPDAIPTPLPFSATGNPDYYDVNGKRYYVLKTNKNYEAEGIASWYGTKFQGKRTSSGEPYDMFAMTAASPNLPIPSFVEVTNLQNGKKVIVKVNDRGPFHEGRVMDLSYTAAKKLGMLGHGTAHVKIVAIDTGVPLTLADNQPNIYIQIGTFKQSNNASLLAQKLGTRLQNQVFVSPVSSSDQILYRVMVGPLASMEQSEELKAMLIAQGLTGSITVRKP